MGVRYLLRLINTSVDTTFIFSIDNHNITVIGMDFVPIESYITNSVLIGIGQRYHVIVEANPLENSSDGNYWIRTTPADGCESFPNLVNDTTGIFRYGDGDTDPTTQGNGFDHTCSDEPYEKLKPVVPWQIPDELTEHAHFVAAFTQVGGAPCNPSRNISRWDLNETPMWLNFSEPTLLNLPKDPLAEWDRHSVIIDSDAYAQTQWVEMVIKGSDMNASTTPDCLVPRVAHPIHLHGHDFALLAQSDAPYVEGESRKLIQRDNPPRRDTALLPAGGYIIIAFKADNPGAWLLHCHIAWHASSGLALQILENKGRIVLGDRQGAMEDTCRTWDEWFATKRCVADFQDDSGI